MDLKELVIRNRSYRGYDETKKQTREELAGLVDYARLTPSSVNIQPFKYRLVWKQEETDAIQQEIKWARALPELELPHKGMRPTSFILICQDQKLFESLSRFQKDVGIVAQTMLLAAVEKGLGGCMICNFNAEGVRKAVNLDTHLAPLMVVAIGKTAETIVLTEVGEDGKTDYYRDAQDIHYVPKRELEDIII